MKYLRNRFTFATAIVAVLLALPLSASADAAYDALKSQVEALQKQLQQVQETLKQYEQQAATKDEVQEVRQEVADVSAVQSEWKNTDSVVHLAGYGDVTYSDNQDSPAAFSGARFNPIFHYQYKDLLMLESEMEVQVEDDGGTSTSLEYMTVDLFVNDYLAMVTGKFLSPLGQFRQNLHPSWINKLPTAPSGFGHDQAAPVSELGLQARGGYPVGGMHMNYAAYVGNGPILEIEDGEIEAIEAEGRTSNDDNKFVFGGRLGLIPWPNSEVGVSLATGKAAGEDSDDYPNESSATRSYDVYGADAAYKWKNLGLRGEYITQKVGSSSKSAAPGSARWDAWYAQAAYRFMPTKFEGVIRYADYDANLDESDQKQWALGVNYLFAPNAMAKLAYNFNDGESGSAADDDSFQVQFTYGF
ncbi:MAG TPA: porin [Gammaproteobacteria bacterium]|nr:porin [Gammaproteobacteria bacterium]